MEIGATRGLYTTDDTVADIEAIRQALGYTKLILYGTSYGTKVALRYAAAYPSNVAGLILDSTVTPNGPDVFDQSSYAGGPTDPRPDLRRRTRAPGSPNPIADLRRCWRRSAPPGPARPTSIAPARRMKLTINADDIASVLLAGDEDPVLRADFPAAIAAAAAGATGCSRSSSTTRSTAPCPNSTVDNPLFFDTECEELPFPWKRTDPAAQRAARGARGGEGAARRAPSARSAAATAYDESGAPDCAYWPFATAAPEPLITAAAERADADHQRRRGPAHTDLQRAARSRR